MHVETAETLALQALGWLAAQDDLFGLFLGATGAQAADLRARASDPSFLGAVLDFVMQDDTWVIGFAHAASIAPSMVAQARAALPGGDLPHWT